MKTAPPCAVRRSVHASPASVLLTRVRTRKAPVAVDPALMKAICSFVPLNAGCSVVHRRSGFFGSSGTPATATVVVFTTTRYPELPTPSSVASTTKVPGR